MEEAAAGKARRPTVESLTDGTMRRLAAAEQGPSTRKVGDACERSQVSSSLRITSQRKAIDGYNYTIRLRFDANRSPFDVESWL